jgi:hypothetical protein
MTSLNDTSRDSVVKDACDRIDVVHTLFALPLGASASQGRRGQSASPRGGGYALKKIPM